MSLLEDIMSGTTRARTHPPSRKPSDAQMPAAPRWSRSKVPLQEHRYTRKLTQAALATAINTPELSITAETSRRLEAGATVGQRDEILRRIAQFFGLPETHARGLVTPYLQGRSYPKYRGAYSLRSGPR